MWNILPTLTEIVGNKPPLHAVRRSERFWEKQYIVAHARHPEEYIRYYFRLYALDASVGLPPKSKRNVVDSAIKGHIIAHATLVGRYAKKGSKR